MVEDGGWAIESYILDDDLENVGITSLVDGARKTSEHVGDGTSTTVALTRAVYDAGRELSGNGMVLGKTPIEIKNQIFEEREIALSALKKLSKPIKTKEDLRKVAIAAYADDRMADIVSDMVFTAGENGIVIVEEGWGRDVETEFVK